jgi:hypothetical protein
MDVDHQDACVYKQVASWATDDVIRWMSGKTVLT